MSPNCRRAVTFFLPLKALSAIGTLISSVASNLWSLLPVGATECSDDYPTIYIYCTDVPLSFCEHRNEHFEIVKVSTFYRRYIFFFLQKFTESRVSVGQNTLWEGQSSRSRNTSYKAVQKCNSVIKRSRNRSYKTVHKRNSLLIKQSRNASHKTIQKCNSVIKRSRNAIQL